MVGNHYRWDFVGLSTDEKPTYATSPKVVNGSTYYCADNSKLYVWCGTQWYEKTASGGGGGTTYTAGDGIDITEDVISVDTTTIQPKLTAGSGIAISAENVISALAGGITTLTTADYNWPTNNPNGIALWLLPSGWYQKAEASVAVYENANIRETQNTGLFYVGYEYSDASKTNFYKPVFYWAGANYQIRYDQLNITNGVSPFGGAPHAIIDGKGIKNDLTTTQIGYVLDAKQGKALKDLIDALDARVTALEG